MDKSERDAVSMNCKKKEKKNQTTLCKLCSQNYAQENRPQSRGRRKREKKPDHAKRLNKQQQQQRQEVITWEGKKWN